MQARNTETECVKDVGQAGPEAVLDIHRMSCSLQSMRPAGYEFAFFPLWSSLTICSHAYDTTTCVMGSTEEKCCQMG